MRFATRSLHGEMVTPLMWVIYAVQSKRTFSSLLIFSKINVRLVLVPDCWRVAWRRDGYGYVEPDVFLYFSLPVAAYPGGAVGGDWETVGRRERAGSGAPAQVSATNLMGKRIPADRNFAACPGPVGDEMIMLFRLAQTSSFHGERISRESMALPFSARGPTKCWAAGSQ